MSRAAQRITKMTGKRLVESELPPARSAKDVVYPRGVVVRQNVRAYAGKIVGPADLNEKRRDLLKNVPPALRMRRS